MKKYIITLFILVAIIIIGFFAYKNKNLRPEITPKNTTESAIQNYVSLVSGGGPDNPHEATFQFLVPVNASDLTATHILHCVLDVNAATPENERNEKCEPIKNSPYSSVIQTSSSNGFSLEYASSTKTLIIRDTDQSDTSFGSFAIGCAACTANVKFTGIHTEEGTLLKDTILTIY